MAWQNDVEYLRRLYKELNRKYFSNELPEIRLGFKKFYGAYAFFADPDKKTKDPPYILMNERVDWNERLVRNVLCHEMIHFHCQIIDGHKCARGKGCHGGEWERKANEISSSKSWKWGKITATRNLQAGKKWRTPFWVAWLYSEKDKAVYARKVSKNCVSNFAHRNYKENCEIKYTKAYIPSLSLDYPAKFPETIYKLQKKESEELLKLGTEIVNESK